MPRHAIASSAYREHVGLCRQRAGRPLVALRYNAISLSAVRLLAVARTAPSLCLLASSRPMTRGTALAPGVYIGIADTISIVLEAPRGS